MKHSEAFPIPDQTIDTIHNHDTLVVGAGLAGLATALRLKRSEPDRDVVVLEKPAPQSNTQIAGQRYRYGIAGKRQDPTSEINHLLASRNSGELTPQMAQFTGLAVQEMNYWQSQPDFMDSHDRPDWFGPQWGAANRAGKGRGRAVIDWFRQQAATEGIPIVAADIQDIDTSDGQVNYLSGKTKAGYEAFAGSDIVLAGGNACGRLFLSTNKDIANSVQELTFANGIPLVDSTLHMIHPFGNCDSEGRPRLGCFETDELVGAKVYLGGTATKNMLDTETTALLEAHQAHYHFPAIAKRFREHGSVVGLELPDGSSTQARVSHHYGHLGIETTDGVSVAGIGNLYAIGDASGIGYWTNHKERFPGFALVKCLTDAALVTASLQAKDTKQTPVTLADLQPVRGGTTNKNEVAALKQLNTRHLDSWLSAADADTKTAVASAWTEALSGASFGGGSVLHALSSAIAFAHKQVGGGNTSEPFRIYNGLGLDN